MSACGPPRLGARPSWLRGWTSRRGRPDEARSVQRGFKLGHHLREAAEMVGVSVSGMKSRVRRGRVQRGLGDAPGCIADVFRPARRQAPVPYRVPERRVDGGQSPSRFDGRVNGRSARPSGSIWWTCTRASASGYGYRTRVRGSGFPNLALDASVPIDGTRALMDSGGDRDSGNDHHAQPATPRHGGPHRPRMEASQPTFCWAGLPACCHSISA